MLSLLSWTGRREEVRARDERSLGTEQWKSCKGPPPAAPFHSDYVIPCMLYELGLHTLLSWRKGKGAGSETSTTVAISGGATMVCATVATNF